MVVVRANCEVGSARGVLKDFIPFLRVEEEEELGIEVLKVTDGNTSKVVRNCYMAVLFAVADASALLVSLVV